MKIASWNCNCNWKSAKAQWKIDLLNEKCGDVDAAFLMEYPNDGLVDFHGITEVYSDRTNDRRGVGLYLNPKHDKSCVKVIHVVPPAQYAFAVGYEITIDCKTINLLGVWNYPQKREYGKTMRGLLDASAEFLKRPNVILMGDFNAPVKPDNTVEAGLSKTFTSLNLNWKRTGDPTWYFFKDKQRPYEIDFCAVSPTVKCKLSNGTYQDFVEKIDAKISASDHLPLILEIQ